MRTCDNLDVLHYTIEHPTHIQASMTLPTRPHAIFSTLQGTQSQSCKELKMPNHSPPTPADEYLSSVAIHFSNITLLDTMPNHHPTGVQSNTSQDNKSLNCRLSKLTVNNR